MTSFETASHFRGIYAATLVPFDETGSIEFSLLRAHLRYCTATDEIRGILCNGHAGENHLLARKEKKQIIQVARETLGERRLIVSGILAEDTAEACLHVQDAIDAGADALLVFPPFSWAVAQDDAAIIAHHEAICAASSVPVMLYQSSIGSGGMAYSLPLLETLLGLPGVIAVKEGSWETNAYDRHRRLAARVAPHVQVMASGDEHLLPCFAIGTTGSLVSLAAILPRSICRLWNAVERGDMAKARTIHEAIQPLASLIYGKAPSSRATLRLKACLVMMGEWSACRTRRPSDILSSDEWLVLQHALEAAMKVEEEA